MKILLLTILCLSVLLTKVFGVNLEEKFSWKEIIFDWPSPEYEQKAIESGKYIPENNLPLGLEVWQDKLFVTIPRWKAGVAASLNYIQLPTDEKSPVLHPYPDWEDNSLSTDVTAVPFTEFADGDSICYTTCANIKAMKSASTIVSTFRVSADECNRLWMVDTGLADILGNPTQVTPPAIVIFDLTTDKLIRRYTFPSQVIKEDTTFPTIIVDVSKGDCENAFAYIPDLAEYAVVVYSLKDNRSWRVNHNFFHSDPLNGDYYVGGVNFQWSDGVFAMTLGPGRDDGTKYVFFHALSSTKEFLVSNSVLQNESYATSPAAYYDFIVLGDRGYNGQSTAEIYDYETHIIFYTLVNKDAVGCWNTRRAYNADTQGIVDLNSTTLEFPNDLKIDKHGYLWVLSDKMSKFVFQSLNPNETNYRILRGKTSEITFNGDCI